ncbi:MAG: hypothetical protein IKN05_04630, partial [Clostridia bacterium]|nr:hypothetical protein [Clostridia bacterium]
PGTGGVACHRAGTQTFVEKASFLVPEQGSSRRRASPPTSAFLPVIFEIMPKYRQFAIDGAGFL